MNECEQAAWVGGYHDGELSGEARAAFERHLRQCPRCAAELARVRALAGMLAAAPAAEMPPAAMARLHRSVDRLPSAGIVRLGEVLAAVAATILITCTIGLTRQGWGQPAGLPTVGETDVLTQQVADPAAGGSEELLARWMVQDLSGRDRRE